MSETSTIGSTPDKSPVIKALRLLAHIAASNEPLGLADLSRAMKLPKPTAYRLARALETVGFVRKDPLTLRYRVGSSFENVALNGLRNSAAHGARRMLMNNLAERLGARVNLVVLKAGNLSFVQWVESTAPLRVDISGDMPMPVHCSASGKLLLAFGPADLREGVFRSAPFRSYTKNTITTARGLARELEEIRQRGYSIDDQELLPGVNCLAVPVHNRVGQAVAGLAVMAPVASLPLDTLKRHLPDLKSCAARISAEFGWEPDAAADRDARACVPNAVLAGGRPRRAQPAVSHQRSAK
jgi:IclR family transcriptional regulator, acetate operon repressor